MLMEDGTYFPYTALPQGPTVLGEEWTGSWQSNPHPYPHYTQVIAEANSIGLHSYLQSGPIQGIDERDRTTYLESVHPQAFPGHDCVSPSSSSVEDPVYAKPADVDIAYSNPREDGMLINVPSDQSRQRYIPVDAPPDFTGSSTVTEISRMNHVATLSRPARRPAGMRERPHSCDICGERFSQRQGVSRHRKAAHNKHHSCLRCEFKWTRPCQYRAHLKKRHPDVNRDEVLGKPEGSRRSSTIIGRELPAIEPNGWSEAKPQQLPPTPPPSAVAKVIHVPSTDMPPVVYNLQHEYAEPVIAMCKNEDSDASGIESFGAADAPSAFEPTEEHVQLVKDADVSIQRGEIWFPPACPPSPEMGLISTVIPPRGGYYGGPVFVNRTGSVYSHPFSAGDDDTDSTFSPWR